MSSEDRTVNYTQADRDVLFSVRDALLGTFDKRGLLSKVEVIEGKIDSHVKETHGDFVHNAEVAAIVAGDVSKEAVHEAQEMAKEAVVAARKAAMSTSESPSKFWYDIGKGAFGTAVGLITAAAVWALWQGVVLNIGKMLGIH